MANIVISRIQHRRGRRENLPQPLLPAEIALTSDTSQAWMGQDPILAVPSINVYTDKLESTAQSIVDNNIVETRFDENMTITVFNTLVAELKVAAGVTLVDDDILWDDTYRGTIETITVDAVGSGYTTGDAITAISATGSGFVGTVTAAAGAITGVVIANGGINFRSANTTFTIAGGTAGVLSVAVTDIYGSTVHIAANPTIDVGNTVANITSTIAGLSTTITDRLLGSTAFGGTFSSNSLIADNHTEAANVAQLINRVNGTTPGEITGLTFTNLNAEITGAGVAGSSFGTLSDVDLTGAADNDMLYRSGGNWIDTAGELTWDPTGNFLQLAAAHSINWLDNTATTVELLDFEPGPSGDADFASVVLLLKATGNDGDTTTTDLSTFAHTVGFEGNADVSTDQTKFNVASFDVRANGDQMVVPDDNAFDLGSGDWTIEFWAFITTSVGGQAFIQKDDNIAGQRSFEISSSNGNLAFEYTTDGSANIFQNISATGTLSQWHYVVVQRNGADVDCYYDGTRGSTFGVSTDTIFSGTSDVYIGSEAGGTQDGSDAYMDDIRITVGVARYGGASMTVPTASPPGPTGTDEFSVGDPVFNTVIDGLTTNITSASTDIDGTLDVTGTVALDSTLFILERAAAAADVVGDGQFWVRDDSPNVAMFTDDTGSDFVLNAPAAGDVTIDQHAYQFSTSTSMFDPGAGFLRFNNATPASITQFDISDLRTDALDIDVDIWQNVEIGSTLRVVDADDLTVYLTFTVTALFDGAGFHIFNVNHTRGTIIPANNANITIQVTQAPYFDMLNPVPANGSLMAYSTTTDTFIASASRGTLLQPSVGLTTLNTSDSVLGFTSASRITTNTAFHVTEVTGTDALILGTVGGNYFIGTGATSASHLDLSAHVGALSVRINEGSTLMILERTGALADITAYGQIWVRDDAPNNLMFTNDIGTDFVLNNAGAQALTQTSAWTLATGGTTTVESGFVSTVQSGATFEFDDNATLDFGTGNDVSLDFDATDFNIAGTGDYNVTGFTDMVINARIVPDAITNPTESVTTTNVITAAESGKTFFLNAVGGFTSTLPVPAAGLKYKFIVATAPTTAYIITTNAGANLLFGHILDTTGADPITYFSAQDQLDFVASLSPIGDTIEVESDGTNWYCKALSGADSGITVTVT